ncbi:MAG TPA: type II toxin-antitoxin system Y4mF family antitoxin [Solirubrobacterales bacterium]|nr:type II toxin-antitoxin system Y4mF family antitoxin [Solirubrobacterales bacterium]
MSSPIRTAEELGARIRARRKELGLRQAELAGVARVTPRFLSELENGKATARLDGVLRVLAALGLDLHLDPR